MNKDFNVYKWRREHLIEGNYQTYGDYERGKSKWGSPNDLKQDITNVVNRIIRADDNITITSIEDQSIEDKGIKFEIKLSTGDVIHAFKVGNWSQQWELYLNRKKSDENSIYFYFKDQLEKNSTPFENWKRTYDKSDKNYQYSDDPRAYAAGQATKEKLDTLYNSLSPEDKVKADEYMK
jgi:hypothetical protein